MLSPRSLLRRTQRAQNLLPFLLRRNQTNTSASSSSSSVPPPTASTSSTTPLTTPSPDASRTSSGITLTYAQILAMEQRDREMRSAAEAQANLTAATQNPAQMDKNRRFDRAFLLLSALGLLSVVPITYYYYNLRKEQMAQKVDDLRKQAGERRSREIAAGK